MTNKERMQKPPEELADIFYRAIKRYVKHKNTVKREEIRPFRLDLESERSVNYAHYEVDKKEG